MSRNNDRKPETGSPAGACLSDCVPGWPLEWVSSRGRFGGRVESLVLVHFSCVLVERDGTKKSLLLTARDRRRRAWSAAVVVDAGPQLEAVEAALSSALYSRVGDVGAALLEPCDPARTRSTGTGPAGVLIPLPVERNKGRGVQPSANGRRTVRAQGSTATR